MPSRFSLPTRGLNPPKSVIYEQNHTRKCAVSCGGTLGVRARYFACHLLDHPLTFVGHTNTATNTKKGSDTYRQQFSYHGDGLPVILEQIHQGRREEKVEGEGEVSDFLSSRESQGAVCELGWRGGA